jgi:hypothetical protein
MKSYKKHRNIYSIDRMKLKKFYMRFKQLIRLSLSIFLFVSFLFDFRTKILSLPSIFMSLSASAATFHTSTLYFMASIIRLRSDATNPSNQILSRSFFLYSNPSHFILNFVEFQYDIHKKKGIRLQTRIS